MRDPDPPVVSQVGCCALSGAVRWALFERGVGDMSHNESRIATRVPVVILAGGLGTRLREETMVRPKPMVEVGGRPIIWHIMKTYDHFGFRRFIVPVGYRGGQIKEYFLSYADRHADFTVNTLTGDLARHDVAVCRAVCRRLTARLAGSVSSVA